MNDFVISVARYLEANDSSLIPVRERSLYPNLDQEQKNITELPPPPSAVNPQSDYASFTNSCADASAPPLESHTLSQQPNNPGLGPTQITHVTNHYHTRSESPFYRQPCVFFPVAPSSTTVFIQQQPNIVQENHAEKKEEKKNFEASPWLGATLLATGTVATTIAVSKLALSRKELSALMEKRRNIRMALISDEQDSFIKQFDLTFAELKKSSNFLTGSALSGGGSALLIGSVLFSGTSSEIASAVALASGCGALAAACYAYFFVSDDRNTNCKKLHRMAKKIIESDE